MQSPEDRPRWLRLGEYPWLDSTSVLLVGEPTRVLVEEFTSGRRTRLIINTALGSVVPDLSFLGEIGTHVLELEVTGGLRDDSGVKHCSRLRSLDLNTAGRGVLPWKVLPELRELSVDGRRLGRRSFAHLDLWVLNIYAPQLHDLTAISNQPLRHLVLNMARSLRSLNGLEGATDLRTLHLAYLKPSVALTPLASLGNLEHLDIAKTKFTSLEWISGLRTLRSLAIEDAGPLDDLSPLASLPLLEKIDIRGTRVAPSQEAILSALPAIRDVQIRGPWQWDLRR